MLSDVTHFQLYYDSTERAPYEDPVEIRERLRDIADEHGLEVETTELSGASRERRETLRRRLIDRLPHDDMNYAADNRVFSPDNFGTTRPVVVIEYEEGPPDVYPHRNYDLHETLPIGVGQLLDELEGDTDAADYAEIRAHEVDAGRDRTRVGQDGEQSQSGGGVVASVVQAVAGAVPTP